MLGSATPSRGKVAVPLWLVHAGPQSLLSGSTAATSSSSTKAVGFSRLSGCLMLQRETQGSLTPRLLYCSILRRDLPCW